MASTYSSSEISLEISTNSTAQKLLAVCRKFFSEIQDLTPGKDLESKLNSEYGAGTPIYEDICYCIREGLKEGWIADVEISGKNYRRSKIALPSEENRFFSITSVFFDSKEVFSGQYHVHPYGEINCVVPITPQAELKGMQGWQGAGWTSPGPGTHHYPQARGGAVVSLFFLPAGRIAYNVKHGGKQPESV